MAFRVHFACGEEPSGGRKIVVAEVMEMIEVTEMPAVAEAELLARDEEAKFEHWYRRSQPDRFGGGNGRGGTCQL